MSFISTWWSGRRRCLDSVTRRFTSAVTLEANAPIPVNLSLILTEMGLGVSTGFGRGIGGCGAGKMAGPKSTYSKTECTSAWIVILFGSYLEKKEKNILSMQWYFYFIGARLVLVFVWFVI